MDIIQSIWPHEDKAVSVKELKEACRALTVAVEDNKKKLESMLSENKPGIKQYNRQSKSLYFKWERCREELDGFKEERAFVKRLDMISHLHSTIRPCTFEDYQSKTMVEWCLEAASSDDLSMVSFTVNQTDYTIRGAFLNLATALQSVQPCTAIGRLYTIMHINAHRGRLESLPQAAALFLSECRLLSILLPSATDILQTGSTFLQVHINTVLDELSELREHGGAMHLDTSNVDHLVKRPFKQIMIQLDRLKQTTMFMRNDDQWLCDVQERMCIVLMRTLADTFWNVIIDNYRGGIAKECIVDIKSMIESILSFYDCGSDLTIARLQALQALSDLPLLQWTAAYRKGTYKRQLTTTDYAKLVKMYFAESAMRSAFVKELMHDDSEEEDFSD